MNDNSTIYTTIDSPFGTLVIAGKAGKICSARIVTDDGQFAPRPTWKRTDDDFSQAREQLIAYFAGELQDFSLPLSIAGTEFQQRTWKILCKVPYGTTTTYGDIAKTMGQPLASRAVGRAMNQNPITIIVPCHRVVGKSGSLTGYLNGIDMKRRLLTMESTNRTA